MFKKGGRALIVIVALGALVFFAVSAFFAGLANDQDVVTAKVPLSAGTRLSPDLLEVRRLNGGAVLPGAFQSTADLKGQVLVSARMPGDQITKDMVGSAALSALAASLAPDTVAVAVKVDQATGLAGVVRVGDRVGVVGIVTAAALGVQDASPFSTAAYAPTPTALVASTTMTLTVRATPTPKIPTGVASRIVLYNLKVLVVPQSFRYEETAPSAQGDSFTTVRTSTSQQQNSVIVLEAPTAPTEVEPGVRLSPVELLTLLNDKGKLHLFLMSTTAAARPVTQGVEAKDLLERVFATGGGK